ncbi:MAG: transposase family protein [Acidobacteria bacterium]|nr:transposase family protein [Acidobacteriota bacterium]
MIPSGPTGRTIQQVCAVLALSLAAACGYGTNLSGEGDVADGGEADVVGCSAARCTSACRDLGFERGECREELCLCFDDRPDGGAEDADAAVPDAEAVDGGDALRVLFARLGPPLVLKSDNESSLKAEPVAALLEAHGVVPLYSPCYYPEYNGACEAGIGTLKTYAHHEAARNDRPGEWTCDDVEGARRRANELARPRGHAGPSPAEAWASRPALGPAARGGFYDRLDLERARLLAAARDEKRREIDDEDRVRLERQAIHAALVAVGILVVRRRRISPRFTSRFWARITP